MCVIAKYLSVFMSLHLVNKQFCSRMQLDILLERKDVLSTVVGMVYVLITMPLEQTCPKSGSFPPARGTSQETGVNSLSCYRTITTHEE